MTLCIIWYGICLIAYEDKEKGQENGNEKESKKDGIHRGQEQDSLKVEKALEAEAKNK